MDRRVVLCIVVAVVILAVALAALALQASEDSPGDSSDSQLAEEVLNSGRVSEDTTITVDSEARIGSDLVVAEGATLTIELSGTIYMDSGSRILVQGSLVVSGSSGASFESGDGSGEEGTFGGAIYVSPGGSASVSICKFARFSSDLYGGAVASEGELTLTNCSFVSCEGPSTRPGAPRWTAACSPAAPRARGAPSAFRGTGARRSSRAHSWRARPRATAGP